MKIASHNSWSYLPIRQWWLRPFAWMARCQSISLQHQYLCGVRLFDLRIRFKGNIPVAVHGFVEYKTDVLSDIIELALQRDCSLRILLDMRNLKWTCWNRNKRDRQIYEQMSKFKRFVEYIRDTYPALVIYDCYTMPYWWKVVVVMDSPALDKSAAKAGIWAVWPWLYAKTHNRKIRKKNYNYITLLDYVNIGT